MWVVCYGLSGSPVDWGEIIEVTAIGVKYRSKYGMIDYWESKYTKEFNTPEEAQKEYETKRNEMETSSRINNPY